MNDYTIALFLHIAGALGFFVALGLEWTSLRHLRRATTAEQVREWMRVPAEFGRVGMVAMVTLLTIGVAATLGLASALPNPGHKRVQEELAE